MPFLLELILVVTAGVTPTLLPTRFNRSIIYMYIFDVEFVNILFLNEQGWIAVLYFFLIDQGIWGVLLYILFVIITFQLHAVFFRRLRSKSNPT